MAQKSSEMSSPQPELMETESEQSDFEVLESDSLGKELIGVVMEEEEEEKENAMKNTVLLNEQTDDSFDLKGCVITPGNTKTTSAMELSMFKTQTALIKAQLKMKKSEIRKTLKVVAVKEEHIKILEEKYKREVRSLEEFSNSFEKKSADAKTQFAEASKAKEELDAVIENLTDYTDTLRSELAKEEKILNKYLSCKNLLFNLSLSQWQETQEAETVKAKVLINKDDQNEMNAEPLKTAVSEGLERDLESSPGRVLPSTKEPTLSPAESDTIVTDSTLDVNSTGYEEMLELPFSDPQQLLGLLSDLRDQILSQIQNSTGVDEILEQAIEITTEKLKEDEERLRLQIDDTKDRIFKEQERADMLRKQVQLHDSLKKQDQDIMLNAVDRKVTGVYLCFVDSRLAYMNTTRKLASIEYHTSLLLQQIESIPEDWLKTIRHIKEMEKRARLRDEKQQLEIEEQRKRMEKCIKRWQGEAKKITGKRCRPRCFPVEQNNQVTEEAHVTPEEDLHSYLFSEDSD